MKRLVLCAMIGCTAVSAAQAQTPSSPGQLLPPSFGPAAREDAPPPKTAPPVLEAQVPDATITVSRIVVEGGLLELQERTRAIVGQIEGRSVPAEALFTTAASLERAYVDAGYVLVRVIVPAQEASTSAGVFRLRVVAGRVEGIDADEVPARSRQAVLARLAPLVGRPMLTRAQFERRLLLAGEVAGGPLRAVVVSGRGAGTVRLRLAAGSDRVIVGVGFDNGYSKALGTTSVTLTAAFNSPLGLGEQVYLAASGHPSGNYLQSDNRRRYFAGGLNLPVGANGLAINLESVYATTRPEAATGALRTGSRFTRFSFRTTYPLLRTRDRSLVLRAALDRIVESQQAIDFGAGLYRDRTLPVRVGVTFRSRGLALSSEGELELSQGLDTGWTRGREDASSAHPISRAGGDDDFTKVEARLRLDRFIAGNVRLGLAAQAQLSLSGPLLASEQFTVGGPEDLSGYARATIAGDDGFWVRAELGKSLAGRRTTAEAYVFGGTATAHVRRPTVLERPSTWIHSLGAGFKTSLDLPGPERPLSLKLELARGFSNASAVHDDLRGTVVVSMTF